MPELFANLDTLGGVHQLAQHTSTPGTHRYSWYSPLTNLPADWIGAGNLVVQPGSIPSFLVVGASTGILLLTDRSTFSASRTFYLRHSFVQHASDAVMHLGDGTSQLGLAAGFGLYGFFAGDTRTVKTGGEIVEALLATGITVQLMKRISGRESPQTAVNGLSRWHPFPSFAGYQRNQPKYYSFPSGHIATTMATITVIMENYPEATWLKPVGYGVLGAVGVSLVNVRYHWFSDLPLGILLGYGFGKLAAHHDGSNSADGATDSPVTLHPTIGREGAGLAVAWAF